MNNISLHKVIYNLQLMSHLWIVQKTELTKKPKFTSSRKNAYFEKRLKNLPIEVLFRTIQAHTNTQTYIQS